MRDALPKLSVQGVDAIGISPDAPEQQKKFDDKYELGFPLLSDPDHRIAEAFGVWAEQKMAGKTFMGIVRSAFLINENGLIDGSWYKISPQDTVPELFKALKG